jgi:hypothetical protein
MATTSRFIPGPGQDNTYRTVTRDYQNPAYAASLAIVTTAEKTLVKVGQLTGALTLTASVGSATNPPFVGDEIEFLFGADSSSRTVTLSTGIAPSATTLVLVASKFGGLKLKFNGTIWQETDRSLTA